MGLPMMREAYPNARTPRPGARVEVDPEKLTALLAGGLSDRLIAEEMRVSESTIRQRRSELGLSPGARKSPVSKDWRYQERDVLVSEKADAEFAKRLAGRTYSDAPGLRPMGTRCPRPLPPPSGYLSGCGNAAMMWVVAGDAS